MRTWWAWAFILSLVALPDVAQARDRGRDGDARERHPSPGRHAERRDERRPAREQRPARAERQERGWNRERAQTFDSGRGGERSAGRGPRGGWNGWDRGTRQDESSRDRGARQDSRRFDRDSRQDSSRWDRGRRDDRGWRGSDRGWRGSDRGWRDSYRYAPRRAWPSFRYRPRYPAPYRYGYVHRHGFYFPRYYFDYEYYPSHGSLRIQAEPSEAEVYVDGYYAGIVDDFDGLFQRLDVAPGPHQVTLRLEGFRTWSAEVYAAPGDTVKLHCHLVPGPSGDEPGVYDEGNDVPPYDDGDPSRYEPPDPGGR